MSPDPVRHADTIIFPASLDPQAVSVVRKLREAGYESYLVGGCVRDLLLGHIPKDFDASTEARPRQIRRVFRNCRVIGRRFKLAHVHFGSHIIEVATFRKNPTEAAESSPNEEEEELREAAGDDALDQDADDLLITRDNVYGTAEEDTLRRDFTINALLYDVLTDEVIDYVGGVKDVDNKILRTIGNPGIRIAEDPVRMLRAVKFTARLGLTMDPELDAAMHASAELIDRSAPPRVLEEIYKMLTCGAAGRALELLLGYGLLERLLPELAGYWKQRPEECIRLGVALDQVDQAKRRVSNSFVLALLFHDVWREALEGSKTLDPLVAARELIAPAAQRMNIPRRDVSAVTQMLLNQSRLERTRKGRRFRMQDFLARDTTVQALDLLYVRCLAGLADPECHARWAMRLAEHHGAAAMPGAPNTSHAQDSTEGGSPKKRRRRSGRRRSSSGRDAGGPGGDRSESATTQEVSSGGRGRSRRQAGRGQERPRPDPSLTGQDAQQTTEERPATRRPRRSRSSTRGAVDRSSPGTRAPEGDAKPASDAAAAGAAAARNEAAPAPKGPPVPGTGFANRIKGLFRRVIGRSSAAPTRETLPPAIPTSKASAGDTTAAGRGSASTPAKTDGQRPDAAKDDGRDDAVREGGETRAGTGAGSSSNRPRRRRRGSRSGSGRSTSGSGTDTGSGSESADGTSAGAASGGAKSGEGRSRRQRSRGGSRKKTSSGSGNGQSRSERGDRSAGGNRSKSSRPRSGSAAPKSSGNKSKDSETDSSGRHPEDIEDTFDW